MRFFTYLEIAFVVLALAFLITQVLIPMWRGTVYFPMFNSRESELEADHRRARTDDLESKLADKLKK